jgi:hypothetical protein
MVCEQCHTRTQASTHSSLAQDLRGYRIGNAYMDFATYTRPAWGKGNRQASIDGKGRRDHQQDMDMRLSTVLKGEHSAHAAMACFDCHDAHGVGNKNKKNPTLKKDSAVATCASCHGVMAEKVLKVMDGRQGWKRAGFTDWGTEFGRQGNKQHIFNIDAYGRSYGLHPNEYQWALKKGGNPIDAVTVGIAQGRHPHSVAHERQGGLEPSRGELPVDRWRVAADEHDRHPEAQRPIG